MRAAVMRDPNEPDDLRRAADGHPRAVAAPFTHRHDRLKQTDLLRMGLRLQGRVDPSDVLQDAFLEDRGACSGADGTCLPPAPVPDGPGAGGPDASAPRGEDAR